MHHSWKISNRNSLHFHRYRCLNVAYGCISIPLQLHFQLRKRKIFMRTQIRRVRGMVKSFAWTTRCSHCSAVNAFGTNRTHSFHFFKSSDRMQWTMVFGILYSLLLFYNWHGGRPSEQLHQSVVFVHFHCSGFPLHSVSSTNFSPAANWACHRNTVAHDTDESPNTFTSISHIFAAVNPALQQNFIEFKIFFHCNL